MRLTLALTLLTTTALAQTPAALTEQNNLCVLGQAYPAPPTGPFLKHPMSATSGTRRIEQWRAGNLIATYTRFSNGPGCVQHGDGTDYLNPAPAAASGCGPFTREHAYALWQSGDIFYVYPAVYTNTATEDDQEPWIGPEFISDAAYAADKPVFPDNITIEGVVQNGRRPVILLTGSAGNNTLGQAAVYFDLSSGLTWRNIDVIGQGVVAAGKAVAYNLGASNFTLADSRISGGETDNLNGLFGAGEYTGWAHYRNLELDHNGGNAGQAHNAYIAASTTDPDYEIDVTGSWSHDACQGHLFKSRAQRGRFINDVFQGGLPQSSGCPQPQAEAYGLDLPNGGIDDVEKSLFIKMASGVGSNGIMLTFWMEGANGTPGTAGYPKVRPQHLTIKADTFLAYARTFDGSHPLLPFDLLYPAALPPIKGVAVDVTGNAFAGFCPTGVAAVDWRGSAPVVEALGEAKVAP